MLATFMASLVCFAVAEQPLTCAAGEACGESDELDSQVLLQTSVAGEEGLQTGNDLCGTVDATEFWKYFFKNECQVDWDPDVNDDLKKDISYAMRPIRLEKKDGGSQGCRVVTPLSDDNGGGTISFDMRPSTTGPATDEAWVGDTSSAVRQLDRDGSGQVVETTGAAVCDLFGDGVPRLVDMPADKVSEAFDQIKKDHARECKVTGDAAALVLATDLSGFPVVGKQSMSAADGKTMYTFEISVSVEGKDDQNIEVWAAADSLGNTDDTGRATKKQFENAVLHKAEAEDRRNDHGPAPAFAEYEFSGDDGTEMLNL